ncbi:hypothetical protein AI2623V1_1968 [Klebsiella oxytoca]|nr:hypothetical protein AI2623V1_1968 [Klebsiella oxytoca]CAH5040873.1 hypothetical protein AI2623V1_1968 [Klebsiella oxytoca]
MILMLLMGAKVIITFHSLKGYGKMVSLTSCIRYQENVWK